MFPSLKKGEEREQGGREGRKEERKEGINQVVGSRPESTITITNFFYINVQNHSSLYTIKRFHFWETMRKEIN